MVLPEESFTSVTACAMWMIVKIGDAALWISAMQYFFLNKYCAYRCGIPFKKSVMH